MSGQRGPKDRFAGVAARSAFNDPESYDERRNVAVFRFKVSAAALQEQARVLMAELEGLGWKPTGDEYAAKILALARNGQVSHNTIATFKAILHRLRNSPPPGPAVRLNRARRRENLGKFYEGQARLAQVQASRPLKPPGRS